MSAGDALFSAYLNAGETLLWTGNPAGPDYSMRAILTAIVCSVGIVFVSYSLMRFFKQIKSWADYWKNHAVISGGLAGTLFFIFFPSSPLIYGLTESRALILNKKFDPPALIGVTFAKDRTAVRKNAGNSETITFRSPSGQEVVFERVRIPADIRSRLV